MTRTQFDEEWLSLLAKRSQRWTLAGADFSVNYSLTGTSSEDVTEFHVVHKNGQIVSYGMGALEGAHLNLKAKRAPLEQWLNGELTVADAFFASGAMFDGPNDAVLALYRVLSAAAQ